MTKKTGRYIISKDLKPAFMLSYYQKTRPILTEDNSLEELGEHLL